MKVHVDFTVEIDPEYLDALRELAGNADTIADVRLFVHREAEEYLLGYLDTGGVRARLARNAYGEETAYSW